MDAILKTIISKIAWDAYVFYVDSVKDLALRVYIAQQLKALEQLEGVSDEKIDEATDIIEATVIETPDKIKQIENEEKQKEVFEKYVNENQQVQKIIKNFVKGNLYGVGVAETGSNVEQNFHFGDTHNHPNQ